MALYPLSLPALRSFYVPRGWLGSARVVQYSPRVGPSSRVNRVAERHANPAYPWHALGYFENALNASASRRFASGLSAPISELLMLSSKRPAAGAPCK